ncbi:hypothetical protein D9M69_410660 [compost metagenome]
MFGGVQEAAGELAAEQRRRTDQKGRGGIGPPGVVRPEVLDAGAIDRNLVEPERGDIEDVVEVAGVADAEEDEQVVDQHHQQHAVDDAQHIDALRLLLDESARRPERQRRLDRAFALQAQVDPLRLVGLQGDAEDIVVLLDLPAREGQRITGALGELVAAQAIGQVEVEVVQRRIGQFHQPDLLATLGAGAVIQIDAQPEYRARITGVEHRLLVAPEAALQRGGGDVLDAGVATDILEHVHVLSQGDIACLLVELHGTGQAREQAKKGKEEDPHAAPQWPLGRTPEPHLLIRRATQGQVVRNATTLTQRKVAESCTMPACADRSTTGLTTSVAVPAPGHLRQSAAGADRRGE